MQFRLQFGHTNRVPPNKSGNNCTLYIVQGMYCTMYIVLCTLYYVHCTMYNVQCI